MKQYLALGERIIHEGQLIQVGETRRLTIYGAQLSFNLAYGFPLVTTKKVWWRAIVEELLWFLNGSIAVEDLQEVGVHIWDANAKPDGTIGDSYGAQWRNWNDEGNDQIAHCLAMLKKTPKSTRNVVLAWNPSRIDKMALPPCHFSFQCLSDGKDLTLLVSMRSTDYCLGLPFNIASYALLTHILAEAAGLRPDRLIMQLSHVHVYFEHIENLDMQLQREPLELPSLIRLGELTPDLKNMKSRQFRLSDYRSHPEIAYKMIVT